MFSQVFVWIRILRDFLNSSILPLSFDKNFMHRNDILERDVYVSGEIRIVLAVAVVEEVTLCIARDNRRTCAKEFQWKLNVRLPRWLVNVEKENGKAAAENEWNCLYRVLREWHMLVWWNMQIVNLSGPLVTPHRKSLLLFLHGKSQYSAIGRTISLFAWNWPLKRYDLMDLGSWEKKSFYLDRNFYRILTTSYVIV